MRLPAILKELNLNFLRNCDGPHTCTGGLARVELIGKAKEEGCRKPEQPRVYDDCCAAELTVNPVCPLCTWGTCTPRAGKARSRLYRERARLVLG